VSKVTIENAEGLKAEAEFVDLDGLPEEGLSLDDFGEESDEFHHLMQLKAADRQCVRSNLLTVEGWPETKTKMKTRCVGAPPLRVCADVPVLYRRMCKKQLYAEVCFPNDLKKDVEDCFKVATAAAIAAFPSGGPGGAKAAFTSGMKGCLAAKLGSRVHEVGFSTGVKTTHGKWVPL